MATTNMPHLRAIGQWWKDAKCNEVVKAGIAELAQYYEEAGDIKQANIYKYLLTQIK